MFRRLVRNLLTCVMLCSTPSLYAQESVTLAWDPSVDATVTGYRVHYGTSSGIYDRNLDAGNVLTATVPDLGIDTAYFFVVTAYNASGLESGPSNEVTATLTATATNLPPVVGMTDPADGATFTAPLTLTVGAEATDPDGTISRVEFYTDSGKLGEDATAPFSIDWSPDPGSHRLWARAYDDAGASTDSEAVTFSVTAPLLAPSSLLASAAVEENRLSWADNTLEEEGFVIECRLDAASPWTVIAHVPTNTTRFIDSGLEAGKTYSYRIKAYNSIGESPYSNEAAATPESPPATFDQAVTSETLMAGNRSGDYLNLLAADGILESITEVSSKGRPSSRYSYLEHVWTFDLAPGGRSRVIAKAHMSDSWDGDVFHFDYSLDAGSSWTPLFTVASLDPDHMVSAVVPATGGPLLVRVSDSDRTPGNLSLDTLFMDHLYVHTDTTDATLPEAPSTLIAEATGSPHQALLTWSDHSHNELGFEVERRVVGGVWLSLGETASNATTYADGEVAGSNAYEYRIRAFNGVGTSGYSNLAFVETPEFFSLNASLSKVRGRLVVTLDWSATGSDEIDIYRDGYKIATVANSGSYVDETGMRTDALVTYWICRSGTDICSNAVVIHDNTVVISAMGGESATETTDSASTATKYDPSGQAKAEAWRAFHFTAEELANENAGDWLADPDGDGLTNLTELAVGTDPWIPGVENLPAVTAVQLNGNPYPQLFFAKRSTIPIEYVVQISQDGTSWESGDGYTTVVTDTPQLLIVRSNVPISQVDEHYMRLTFLLPD